MEYLEYRISQLRSWKQGNLFIGAVESRPRFLSKVWAQKHKLNNLSGRYNTGMVTFTNVLINLCVFLLRSANKTLSAE